MTTDDWKRITVQFAGNCVICKIRIEVGEIALWKKDIGLKHENCYQDIQQDTSTLIILEKEDEERLGITISKPTMKRIF